MSREKQIDEMEKISAMDCDEIKGVLGIKTCIDLDCHDCIARLFYAKGYRKAFDVAAEIFAEIEKAISNLEYKCNYRHTHIPLETMTEVVNWVLHECVPNRLAELKKKYEEGDNNG